MQQAALSRRERQFDMVMRLLRFGRFLVVRLRKSAKSAGDIGVSCIYIEYACMVILSQIAQRSQRNAARLHYFAEEDSLLLVSISNMRSAV
jgi:hypothetical protein